MKIKQSIGSKAFDIFNHMFLLLLALVMIYPMYYIFIVSISNGTYVLKGLISLYPKGITFEVYKTVFSNPDILRGYGNTLLYTGLGTLINVVMTALCAYPLSRKDLYGRKYFTFYVTLTMFISGGLIPSYIVVLQLKLINTMWALLLPGAISTWNMIIMRTFFMGIPDSLHESAGLDGANDIQILGSIILPLSKPIFATMILFYAVGHWNSWFSAVIYLSSKVKYPVQVFLRQIVIAGEFGEQQGTMGAGSEFAVIATNYKYAVIIITVVPILLVYPYLQKHFTKGVMIGSIKG